MPWLAEYVAAFGLCDQVFENRLRFLVDFEHAFAGPPLEPALDDEVAPVAVLVGIFADDHAISFEVQHLDARDARVARQNRRRAQRLFGVVDPELVGRFVENVFNLTLVLILLDHRGLVDDLQFRQAYRRPFLNVARYRLTVVRPTFKSGLRLISRNKGLGASCASLIDDQWVSG